MAVIEIAKIQVRRGQELQTGIPQLDPGEFGWAEDTENLYIGKRISEGAADDENTRVLTEKDLNYFKLLAINNTSTAASAYEYRNGIFTSTVVTSIQDKLDSLSPSLVDFGISTSTAEIHLALRSAIAEIFNNDDPNVRIDRRRILEIPAGEFTVDGVIELPPYTKLRGAGSGLTKIRYINTLSLSQAMMVTVDQNWNRFEDGNMSLSTGYCRDIVIEGITFEFSDNLANTSTALISLDNVRNAIVQDCTFQTKDAVSFVDYGVGVRVRGQGDFATEGTRNIAIDRCEFKNILTAVHATGTVVAPSIRNSVFQNLDRGVMFERADTGPGPTNGYIAYNRFEDVKKEAIYVGANPGTNTTSTSHLSTQNYFARCGGDSGNEFTTGSSVTSVIRFDTLGNKTVDDYFARRLSALDVINDVGFYFNPFVRGTTTVADSAVYTKTVGIGSTDYAVIPLNGGSQVARVNYQLYNDSQSRKGTIVANISADGYVALTDNFNYIETLSEDTRFITTQTGSDVNVLVVDAAAFPRFGEVQTSLGLWYLTGEAYPGKSAFINDVDLVGPNYVIRTDSDAPVFNFASTGTWTLLLSKNSDVAALYDTTYAVSKNFVTLTMSNPSTITNFTLDFQIDIQT